LYERSRTAPETRLRSSVRLALTGFRTQGLDHVALSVRDQERSECWYREVLGLERVHEDAWGDVPVVLVADGTGVALFRARQGEDGKPAVRILHIAFRVDRSSFEAARGELEGRGIEVSFEDHVVAHSLYFSDPDGHQLELTTYEL
jgi:catechol 2,3-dioxygenase-like lactoylglutathione lyase family enzyme